MYVTLYLKMRETSSEEKKCDSVKKSVKKR